MKMADKVRITVKYLVSKTLVDDLYIHEVIHRAYLIADEHIRWEEEIANIEFTALREALESEEEGYYSVYIQGYFFTINEFWDGVCHYFQPVHVIVRSVDDGGPVLPCETVMGDYKW
jgi:hypothetical protein